MSDETEQLERLSRAPIDTDGTCEDNDPEPLLGDLIEEIALLIQRFILLSVPELAVLIAVWLVGTYLFERFQYFGYLGLRSATPRCGKTRLLRLIALLAFGNPPITATPTAAVLFRRQRAVLALDEVDRLRNADRETFGDVMAVLNVGFEQGGIVERCEKGRQGFEVKAYHVYGPKALAGIEALADTLADRCFHVQMERTPKRMPRLNIRRLSQRADAIRSRLAWWAQAHGEEVEQSYGQLPDEVPSLAGFDDRLQDIAEPLVVLAGLADAERPPGPAILPSLLHALQAAAGRREPSDRERSLLAFLDLAKVQLNGAEEVFVASADLLTACQEREELAWIETTKRLAQFLKSFDLRPGCNAAKTQRGYTVLQQWVEGWEGRYAARDG